MHKGALEKLKQDYLNEMNETKKAPAPKMSQEKEKEVMKNELNNSVKDAIKDFGKVKPLDNKYEAEKVNVLIKNNDYINGQNQTNKVVEQAPELPPKPLPRTSRSGSVADPAEELPPKPVARPRTNSCAPVVTSVNPNMPVAGGYKVHINSLTLLAHLAFIL